jgi:diaminohydroxyphosphoribosylaminopyrimidine deaminase/5-amino-6-(5-phosphoribosylamino)uracil reductase
MAMLAEAGIAVHWGPRSDEGRELIADFAAWVEEGRPFVTLKWAQTLDAKIAGGPSRWITGEPARVHARQLRARHDAVAVGAGTLRDDNPQLTVRDGSEARPKRLIFAGKTPLPEKSEVFIDADRDLTWVVAGPGPVLEQARRLVGERALEWDGDAATLGPLLLAAGFRRVLVEGGTKLIDWFLKAGLWDQAAVFIAPRLLGEGLAGPGAGLSEPKDLARVHTTLLGDDVLIEGWNPRCAATRGVSVESEAVCSPV